MRLYIDDDSETASEAGFSTNEERVADTDAELFSADEQQLAEPTYSTSEQGNSKRRGLIEQAKRNMKRARATVQNTVPKQVGKTLLGDNQIFRDGSSEGRKKAKEVANKKARKFVSDKLAEKVGDKALKTGLKKGLSKSASKVGKEGAKKVGRAAAEKATKGVIKEGIKQGVGKGVGTTVGAATGVETFGVGFLIGFLINIAISLGISDAVDAMFELSEGNIRQAKFLAIRGGAKVGMFVYLLLCLVSVISIAGVFLAVPMLFFLNVYMLLGFAFKKIPQFQGLVWWEIGIILIVDIFAFLILMAFLGALGWYLCGEGTVSNMVMGAIATVYDWWNKSDAGGVAADFCKYINATASSAVPAP